MRSGVRTSVGGIGVFELVAVVEKCWMSVSHGVQGRVGDLGDEMVSASGVGAGGLPYVHAV